MCTVVIEKFTEDGIIFISTRFASIGRTASRGFEKLPDKRFFAAIQSSSLCDIALNHIMKMNGTKNSRLVMQYTSGVLA